MFRPLDSEVESIRTTHSAILSSKKREGMHGSKKEVQFTEKIEWTKVWQIGRKNRGQRDASQEERHSAFWQGGQGGQSKEPQASHRNWTFGSAEEGGQGPAEEGQLNCEGLEPKVSPCEFRTDIKQGLLFRFRDHLI
jgi:hypothetical protein